MRSVLFLVTMLSFGSVALAEQTVSPAQMQRVVDALAVQRNVALNAQAISEANLAEVREELAKAQARIKELETPQVKK